MKININKKIALGTMLVALAFSEGLKSKTSWMFPFIMLSIIVSLFLINVVGEKNTQFGKKVFKQYCLYALVPYVMIFLYSCIVIYIGGNGKQLVNRNIGTFVIAVFTVFISASLLYLYKDKAMDVVCYGLILNYCIHVLISLKDIGISGLIIHILNPLNTYQRVFEQHSIGFTLNLLLLYYLVGNQKNVNIKKIVIILVIDYLIMKRIAVIGTIVSLLVWFYGKYLLKNKNKKKYIIIHWMLFIASFICIWIFCDLPEIYKAISHKLNIYNRYLMARGFYNYIEFKISFMGKGQGFVSVLMPEIDIAGSKALALHNDLLRNYIELGFWGFGILQFYFFVYCPRKLYEKSTEKSMLCITMVLVFIFVCCLTDNVLEYVSFMCTLFTMMGILFFYDNKLFEQNN